MPSDSVPLILTDIPYGAVSRPSGMKQRQLNKGDADIVTFVISDFMAEISRICNGSVYVFCGKEQFSTIFDRLVNSGFSARACVWEKNDPSPMNGQHLWLSSVELCAYGKLPNATFNQFCKSPVWHYPIQRHVEHPTPKSLELFKHLVYTSSNEGDIVFDPCCGSGTTCVAAEILNRQWVGIELSPDYCEIARARVKDEQQQLKLF
jgi:DNA modification methylase